jgi:hypothetical protein
LGGHGGNVVGFGRVDGHGGFGGVALGDGAESATPSADVAEDHESGRATVEALVDIWAARGFADGVEIVSAQIVLEELDRLEVGGRLSQKVRQALARLRSTADLDEAFHEVEEVST